MEKLHKCISRIDLRSDTVTQPCSRMKQVMMQAKLGDDVFEDDPTVHQLQHYAANLLNKPKALLVPSGTMGNLISVAAHCQRGDEIILGKSSHIFLHEGAGISAYMGIGMNALPNQDDGTLSLSDVENAIREDDIHYPRTSLVAIENTSNTMGGKAISVKKIKELGDLCAKHQLAYHMDGARLANASVALNVSLAELVEPVDSVSLCLSKGLGAPVGSIIAGSEEFIYRARRLRKSLGGGMRQSGILAAAGLYALEHNISRLAIDHENAKRLARGLESIPGIRDVSESGVDTNIVFFSVDPNVMAWDTFIDSLKGRNILMGGGYGKNKMIRAVLHKHITPPDVDSTLDAVRLILS